MLARAEGALGEIGMERVRQDDIDRVDIRIVLDVIEIVVRVDVLVGNIIRLGDFLRLDWVAAYQADKTGMLTFGKGRNDLINRIFSEADNRIAKSATTIRQRADVLGGGTRRKMIRRNSLSGCGTGTKRETRSACRLKELTADLRSRHVVSFVFAHLVFLSAFE